MTTTKSTTIATDIRAMFKARTPLIWINTREEERVEGYLFEAAAALKMPTYTWDCGDGLRVWGKNEIVKGDTEVIDEALKEIGNRMLPTSIAGKGLWIMRDLAPWVTGPIGIGPARKLRNLAKTMTPVEQQQAIVVLAASGDIPPELAAHAVVMDWPLPDRQEIADMLDDLCELYSLDLNGQRDAAIDAAIGLSGDEAKSVYAKSIVQTKTVTPAVVYAEKKRVIAKDKVLSWYDPLPGGLDAVGGLGELKMWLKSRVCAFSQEARAYGLAMPKGCMVVGVPGGGKSMIAKALATFFGVPLIRLDLNAAKGKFVGESEASLRRALQVIDALGFCVVWIDEIEKALAGATQGAADGGVSADALGTVLSWMQERTSGAFVMATANDVSALPPELMRKGRWDEVWFVDLPSTLERVSILQSALAANGRADSKISVADAMKIAQVTDGFTGAEIASVVPEAMFTAFNDGGRELTTTDVLTAAATVTPLSKLASEKIEGLRKWATKSGARRASSIEDEVQAPRKIRALDI